MPDGFGTEVSPTGRAIAGHSNASSASSSRWQTGLAAGRAPGQALGLGLRLPAEPLCTVKNYVWNVPITLCAGEPQADQADVGQARSIRRRGSGRRRRAPPISR